MPVPSLSRCLWLPLLLSTLLHQQARQLHSPPTQRAGNLLKDFVSSAFPKVTQRDAPKFCGYSPASPMAQCFALKQLRGVAAQITSSIIHIKPRTQHLGASTLLHLLPNSMLPPSSWFIPWLTNCFSTQDYKCSPCRYTSKASSFHFIWISSDEQQCMHKYFLQDAKNRKRYLLPVGCALVNLLA